MNWIDAAIFVSLVWFTYSAFHAGLIREVVTIIGAVFAVALAGLFYLELAEDVKVAVGPAMESAHEWAVHVGEEWKEPYEGKIFHAYGCMLAVCDPTWPSCLGLRFKGLCCCVQGECTMCIMT